MLKLALYDENILEFLNSLHSDKHYKAICPSPGKADIFRDILIQANLSANVEVVTISNFVKSCTSAENLENIASKSSLLLDFWTLWKMKISTDYSEFRRIYDLFTEIRSFSCEDSLIEELKVFLTESEFLGISLFNNYLKTSGKIDEQQSYNLATPKEDQNDIILWGYDHLNANQIQLFKKIGADTDVFVPLPNFVFANCKNNDWPNWISTQESQVLNEEILTAKAVIFPEARASQYLEGMSQLGIQNYYFLNLDSDISALVLASRDFHYKSTIDIFNDNISEIFEEISSEELDSIYENIKEKVVKAFAKKEIIKFKILMQLSELLTQFRELAQVNEKIIFDDLFCLREKLSLDLPRTSWITLVKNEEEKILSLDYLSLSIEAKSSALYITKNMAKSFQGQNKFIPEIKAILQVYGPIQSKNVLLANSKYLIKQFTKNGGLFFIEDGAFDHLLEWDDVKENIQFTKIDTHGTNTLLYEIDVSKELIKNYSFKSSATAIQTYLDCPRKFYYSYIDLIDIRARGESSLTPDLLGTIEHEVIDKCVQQLSLFTPEKFIEIVAEVFRVTVIKNNLSLSLVNTKRYLNEVVAHTTYITEFLIELKKNKEVSLEFEFDLAKKTSEYRGRIDLIIKYGDEYTVLDFKRSKSSIPSAKSLLEFEKVQIWYYLNGTKSLGGKIVNFGFLSLSNLEDSLFYFDSDNFIANEFSKFLKTQKIEDLNSKIDEVNIILSKTQSLIIADTEFLLAPRGNDVCRYCIASPVCSKGASHE